MYINEHLYLCLFNILLKCIAKSVLKIMTLIPEMNMPTPFYHAITFYV
jgi:hypothetical protein